MDLASEARRILLDLLCVDACRALAAADIPHVVLKGPSTALWLYDPPRTYRDVDLLVPVSRLRDAVGALETAKVAAAAERLGEGSAHSLVLLSPRGFEVDLHVTLPMLAPRSLDETWKAIAEHISSMDLGGTSVPVLDLAGRCLVLSLHAVASGNQDQRVREDIARAIAHGDAAAWEGARDLARDIGAEVLMDDGLAVADPTRPTRSVDALLKRSNALGSAFGLQRVAQQPGVVAKVREVAREAFPSAAFMRRVDSRAAGSRYALAGAYGRRLRRLAHELPGAIRQWQHARRTTGRQ